MNPGEISNHAPPEVFVPQWIRDGKPLSKIIDRLDELEYPEKRIKKIIESIVMTALLLKADPNAATSLQKEGRRLFAGGIGTVAMAVIFAIVALSFALFGSGIFFYGLPLAIGIYGITMATKGASQIKRVKECLDLAQVHPKEQLEELLIELGSL